MEENNEDEPNKFNSETEENTSEDLTVNDTGEKQDGIIELRTSNVKLYFDVDESVLFKDVPENEETLEMFLASGTGTNERIKDLNENCSIEIEELGEKYIKPHNLYSSLKVYKCKPKSAVLSGENVSHPDEGPQVTHTNLQMTGNECDHNVINDTVLPSDEPINIDLNNNASSSTAENEISVVTFTSCSSGLSYTQKSIASSLKELSQNLKSESASAETHSLSEPSDVENLNSGIKRVKNKTMKGKESDMKLKYSGKDVKLEQQVRVTLTDFFANKEEFQKLLQNENDLPAVESVGAATISDNCIKINSEPNVNEKGDKFSVTFTMNIKKQARSIGTKSCKKSKGKLSVKGRDLNQSIDENFKKHAVMPQVQKNEHNLGQAITNNVATSSSQILNGDQRNIMLKVSDDAGMKAIAKQAKFLRKNSLENSVLRSNDIIHKRVEKQVSSVHKISNKSVKDAVKSMNGVNQSVPEESENISENFKQNKNSESVSHYANKTSKPELKNQNLKAANTFGDAPSALVTPPQKQLGIMQMLDKVSEKSEHSKKTMFPRQWNFLDLLKGSQKIGSKSPQNERQTSDASSNLGRVWGMKVNTELLKSDDDIDPSNVKTPNAERTPPKRFTKNTAINKIAGTSVLPFSSQLPSTNNIFTPKKRQGLSVNSVESISSNSPPKEKKMNLSSVKSSNFVNTLDAVSNGSFMNVNAKKTVLNQSNISELHNDISPPIVVTSKVGRKKKSLAKNAAKSKVSETSFLLLPHISSAIRSVPRRKQELFTDTEESLSNNSSLKKRKVGSFSSAVASFGSTVGEDDSSPLTDVDNFETRLDSNFSVTSDDIYLPCVEKSKTGRKKSLAKSKISETLVLQSPCAESFNTCPNGRSTPKKKVELPINSEGSISNNSVHGKEEKMNLFLAPSSHFENILSGDNNSSLTDVETEPSQLIFSNTHDLFPPFVETTKVVKKKKLAKSKKPETSVLSSACSKLPCTNNIPTEKKQALCKNSVDSISNNSPFKKRKKVNSLSSVASFSHFVNTSEVDNSFFISDVDTVKTETVQSNLLVAHGNTYAPCVEPSKTGKKKKLLVKNTAKCKVLEHSSLVPSSHQSPGISTDNISILNQVASCNNLNNAAESKCSERFVLSSNNAPIKVANPKSVGVKGTSRRNIHITPSTKQKPGTKNSVLCVEDPRPVSKGTAVLKRELSTPEQSICNISPVEKRCCNSTHSTDMSYFEASAQNNDNMCTTETEEIPLGDVGPNTLRDDSAKRTTKYVRSKRSLEPGLCRIVDNSKVQSETSKRNNCVERTPRKSARLKKRAERPYQVSSKSPDVRKKLSCSISNSAGKFIKVGSSPKKKIVRRSNTSLDLSQSFNDISSNIANQNLKSPNVRRKLPSTGSLNSGKFIKMQSSPEKNIVKDNYSNLDFSQNFNSTPSSISSQNCAINNMVPHSGMNQIIPINTFYNPATNCIMIPCPLMQSTQIVNPVTPNVNQFNSRQISQVPLQMLNPSNNVISQFNSSATSQNVFYPPVYQARPLSQSSNILYSNPHETSLNTVSGLQRAFNNETLNANSSPGNHTFTPHNFNATQPAHMRYPIPNIADINTPSSSSSPVTTVAYMKDTVWTQTTRKAVPQSVRSQNRNVQPHAISSSRNQKLHVSNCKNQDIKSPVICSPQRQNVDLHPVNNLENQNTLVEDIVNGMINWSNVMHNLTGFTCLTRMARFTSTVFSAYDFDEFITVKDYYSNVNNINMLKSIVKISTSDFQTPCKVKYVFHESFFDNPMRQIVKDYISYYTKYVRHETSVSELIEQVHKQFCVSSVVYLSIILPNDGSKTISRKMLINYFTFLAVLRIYDEYEKRVKEL